MGTRANQTTGTIAVLLLAGLTLACQKQSTGPTASDYQKKRAELIAQRQLDPGAGIAAPQKPSNEGVDGLGAIEAGYAYDPMGKRDPFRSFVLDRLSEESDEAKGPLEQFDLAQIQLLGVVWKTDRPRALVSDPSGQSYVVRTGDPIGKNEGEIVAIDDNSMRVVETYVDYVGSKTTKEIEVRVRQSEGG
jgi:type IV pilus assembly protein PilP